MDSPVAPLARDPLVSYVVARPIYCRFPPNHDPELSTDFQKHGDVLMFVNQPNSIAAIEIAVVHNVDCTATLPQPENRVR